MHTMYTGHYHKLHSLLQYYDKLSVPDSGNKRCHCICTGFERAQLCAYTQTHTRYTIQYVVAAYTNSLPLTIRKLHTDSYRTTHQLTAHDRCFYCSSKCHCTMHYIRNTYWPQRRRRRRNYHHTSIRGGPKKITLSFTLYGPIAS